MTQVETLARIASCTFEAEELASLLGMSVPQALVVTALRTFGGSASMGDIACASRRTGSSVTTTIDRMERAGLVRRERSTEDRRVIMVRLAGA